MQSLCTLRDHCRQWPRNTRYQAGRYSLLGPDFHRLDRTSLRAGAPIRSPRRRARAEEEGPWRPSALAGFHVDDQLDLGRTAGPVGRLASAASTSPTSSATWLKPTARALPALAMGVSPRSAAWLSCRGSVRAASHPGHPDGGNFATLADFARAAATRQVRAGSRRYNVTYVIVLHPWGALRTRRAQA